MKKLISLFVLLCSASTQLLAQTDSLNVVNAKWSKHKLAKKTIWKSASFVGNSLFHADQNINIIEFDPSVKTLRLAVVYSDSLDKTSAIAQSNKAIAGVNGSFFKMRGPDPDHDAKAKGITKLEPSYIGKNRSVVYLRANDSLISPQVFAKDSVRKRHQQGVVAVKNDEVAILEADPAKLSWEAELKAIDVMSSGPIMLLKGKAQPIPDDAFCNDRHPRTAVGKKADGTILLFVVDGRSPKSAGMSIPELLKTMKWLGCVDAINLDGGGSTTMYVKGQPFDGVVNYPTDNKKFDHTGEREVANALMILPK